MKTVLITGGTGLLGKRITQILLEKGYGVSLLSRSKRENERVTYYEWDGRKGYIEKEALQTADYIINLAGASIASGRWTDKQKRKLYKSRILSTKLLYDTLKQVNHNVQTVLSASAIGYYPDSGGEWLDELHEKGSGFLADLCADWEKEAVRFNTLNIRTVSFRIGIVLSATGGALPKLTKGLPLSLPYFGSGEQYQSWIHINDLANLFVFALENEKIKGVYNAVAPNPITQKELMQTIKEVKQTPAFVSAIPAFAIKAGMGEMSEIVLASQRCKASKIQNAGFRFEFKAIEEALSELL